MKKGIFLIFISVFSILVCYADCTPQYDPQAYHGKRIQPSSSNFQLSGIRIIDATENCFYIDLFFNSEVNPRSIKPDSFSIFLTSNTSKITPITPLNKDPIPYRFMKNSKGLRLEVCKSIFNLPSDEPIPAFALMVQKVNSWELKEIQITKITNLEINSQYHYSTREKKWKKF